jgi:hypothetical protein
LKNKEAFKEAAKEEKKSKPSPLDYLKGKGLDAMKTMVQGSPLDYLKGKGVGGAFQRSMSLRERELEAKRMMDDAEGKPRKLSFREREMQINGAGSKVVARVRSRREKEDSESKTMVRHLSQIANNTSKLQVV